MVFFLPTIIWAQTLDKEYVKAQNTKAAALDRDGEFEAANKILDNLIILLEEQEADSRFFATTYQTKAKIIKNLGSYEESTEIARKSLRISLSLNDSANIADTYNTIGVNHYFLSDYDSTTYYYEKSFEIKKKINIGEYGLAVSAYNLAIVFEDLGQVDKALELYKEAETNLIKSGIEKTFLSDVYVGLSHLNFYAGDVNRAEAYSEKAMDVGIYSYGEFNPNMTFVYVSYANILESQGKHNEAIALLEKSLKIRRSTYGENHRWTCESHYDLANSYMLIGDYEKAEKLYKRAIEIGQGIESGPYLANAKNYLAKLYLDQGINLDQAEEFLREGLEKNISVYGPKNEIVSENYRYLARLFKIKKKTDGFVRFLDASLNSANYEPDSIKKVIAPIQALTSLMLLGEWHENKYNETSNIEFLYNWYALIDEQIILIEYIQKNFSSDRSKINLANEYRDVFEKGMNLCWKLYHTTGEYTFLEKAFELSETNRNTSLLNGLQDVKYKLYSEIPFDKLEFENKIKKELERVKMDLYYEKTADSPNKEVYSELLNSRIVLTNSLDSIHDSFDRDFPRYRDLKYDNKIISISDVQEGLAEDAQVITYFLGEKHLYSFSITKSKVNLLRGDVAKKLVVQTNLLRKNLEERNEVEEYSKNLYLFLISQQIDPSKKDVVIIADNILSYIPFEILQKEDDTYLLEDYIISYSGSARIFLELENRFYQYQSPRQWAGFSPEYLSENVISSTSVEIEEIANLMDGDKFIREASTKENFLENNQKFSVLHLAMHAEINRNNPAYNKLIFADGDLTSSEIYTSNSKANLVVLSACNTGSGKLEKGEGVMSMARAFHFSGIPAVVMSLWKVPDFETKTIMIDFYKYLKKGKSKNEALRLSKLDYLKSTSDIHLRHPYFWSGFVISGNTAPLVLKQQTNYILWFGILLFASVLAVILLKRSNN